MVKLQKKWNAIFDMRPYFIEQRLKLRNPIYQETAAYGHMGTTRMKWLQKPLNCQTALIKI